MQLNSKWRSSSDFNACTGKQQRKTWHEIYFLIYSCNIWFQITLCLSLSLSQILTDFEKSVRIWNLSQIPQIFSGDFGWSVMWYILATYDLKSHSTLHPIAGEIKSCTLHLSQSVVLLAGPRYHWSVSPVLRVQVTEWSALPPDNKKEIQHSNVLCTGTEAWLYEIYKEEDVHT